MASLKANEALTAILSKYVDLADAFSSDLVTELPKYTRINNHAIKLIDSKQPPYKPIYSLEPMELEILKT